MHDTTFGSLREALYTAAEFGGDVNCRTVSGVIVIREDGTVEKDDGAVVENTTPSTSTDEPFSPQPRLEIATGESENDRNTRRLRELENVITGF